MTVVARPFPQLAQYRAEDGFSLLHFGHLSDEDMIVFCSTPDENVFEPPRLYPESIECTVTPFLRIRTPWVRPSAQLLHSGFLSVHRNKSTMRRVQSVGTASLPVEGIAASAGSDYAAHRAEQLLWEGTTAIIVDMLSSPNTGLGASRVCTNSVYVQLYT